MAKTPHPVELKEREIIDGATSWSAFVQVAPGDRRKVETSTRAEALEEGRKLATETRKTALVYAINHEGRQALAFTIKPEKDQTMTTVDTTALKAAAPKPAAAPAPAKAKPAAAPKAEKPAKAPKAAKPKTPKAAPATDVEPTPAAKALGKRAQVEAEAQDGKLPPKPDFTADTHARFRPKLAQVVALVEAKDIAGLKGFPINPVSSSPKALDRYRNLAVVALEAQARKPR